MKRINALFIFCVLLLVPLMAISATNPKWISPITMNVRPTILVEGKVVTFSATLKVKQGPVDNLKVIARIDSTKIFETIYPHLNKLEEKTVSVNWTATLGNHRIKFKIDPENTSGDVNQDDNKVIKDFSVRPKPVGPKPVDPTRRMQMIIATPLRPPELELTLYSLPRSPQVGDTVDVTAHVKNIGEADSKICNLRFKDGAHYTPTVYTVPPIKNGKHFEITTVKKLGRAITYSLGAELWGSTDSNQANNKASLDITPRAPDLIISKFERGKRDVGLWRSVKIKVWVKNVGNADSGPFDIDAYFEPCKGIARGRRWKHVDNLKPQEEVMKELSHKWECLGYRTLLKLVVDSQNDVIESDETNNHLKTFPLWLVR